MLTFIYCYLAADNSDESPGVLLLIAVAIAMFVAQSEGIIILYGLLSLIVDILVTII